MRCRKLLALLPPLLFAHLQNLVLVLDFQVELLIRKVQHLNDLLLSVEPIDECALLGNLQELDEEVLLLDAAITDAKLHEEVLEADL